MIIDVYTHCKSIRMVFMNRQDFLRNAKRYSLYFKPRNEEVESVIREKCSESNTDINAIIDFAKWVDDASFRRPETNSDDILEFVIGPRIRPHTNCAKFWSDINKTVFYNGYIKGIAGIIKTMYVSTDGRFYDHKHELIAANEEDFFDYLLSVEFDFHPIIKECVYNALREAGWYEGRCVDTTRFQSELERVDIILSKAQLDFIKEFSGITVEDSEGLMCRFLSMEEILDDILPYYTNNKRRRDEDFLMRVINSDVSDFPYCIDSNGIIECRGFPQGRTTMEGVNNVIKELFCWGFDIDEPMDNPQSIAER